MDHNQKHSKGFLTRINTTQEWEEIERKFQWQNVPLEKTHLLYKLENQLTSTSRHVSWFWSLYKRCVFSRGTFCHWNFRSISSHSWVVLILVRKPLECFWLWSMVLLAYLSDDSLMWADFQVYIKDASFREEHFCDWNFRSTSSHSWVVLILVRKPLECFWLWSIVLLAYLSDDSLMWADFQVYIKDASFREEHFCHWNFRSISSYSWVVLILVRKPLECFWLWSMVLLAYLSDDSLR